MEWVGEPTRRDPTRYQMHLISIPMFVSACVSDCIGRESWAFGCFENTSLEMLSQERRGEGAPTHLQPNISSTFISPTTAQRSKLGWNFPFEVSEGEEKRRLQQMVTSLSLETRSSRHPPIRAILLSDFFDKFESPGKESDWQSALFYRARIDNWHPLVREGANLSRKKRRTKLLRIAFSNFISAPLWSLCYIHLANW